MAPPDDAICAGSDSTTPWCGSEGICVECRQSSDCTAALPVCDQGGCRECSAGKECASGACNVEGENVGTCVSPADVAYVNRTHAQCSDSAHSSTRDLPYCQIQAAATVSGKTWISVAGSATAYAPVSLAATASDLTLRIVGPGEVSPPATVELNGAAAVVAVSASASRTAKVSVEGMKIGAGTRGIQCSGAGTVEFKLRNLQFTGSTTAGVEVGGANCSVLVSDSMFRQGARGLYVTNGSAAVERTTMERLGLAAVEQSAGTVALQTVNIVGGSSDGIRMSGGTLTADELNIADAGSSGISVTGGTATFQAITLSKSLGYGLQVAGATADVTLANSVISGNTQVSVRMESGTAVVRDTELLQNTGGGVSQVAGDLTVERSTLRGNLSHGISINGGTYSFVNNLFQGNATPGALMNGSGTFAFNTVVSNGSTFNCAGGTKVVQSSIFRSNTPTGGSQFQGTCQLSDVVTGTDSFAGAIQKTPALTSDGQFDNGDASKQAANADCCIDKITPGAGTPAVDRLGQPRPTGSALDLGAFEAP